MSDLEISSLLASWDHQDTADRERLIELLYPQLKKIASRSLSAQGRATLDTTELVNEAYLKLIDQRKTNWQNRGHFYAIAARLIRRLVVDHVRKKLSEKRGSGIAPLDIDDIAIPVPASYPDWLDLDRALEELEQINAVAAQIVELRYLTGFNISETAQALGIGEATVGRQWRFARSWLQTQLDADGNYSPN